MATEWFVQKGDKWHGPFSSARLKELAAGGKLHANDLVRKGSAGNAVHADKVKGLLDEPPQSSPEAATTEPPVEKLSAPWFKSSRILLVLALFGFAFAITWINNYSPIVYPILLIVCSGLVWLLRASETGRLKENPNWSSHPAWRIGGVLCLMLVIGHRTYVHFTRDDGRKAIPPVESQQLQAADSGLKPVVRNEPVNNIKQQVNPPRVDLKNGPVPTSKVIEWLKFLHDNRFSIGERLTDLQGTKYEALFTSLGGKGGYIGSIEKISFKDQTVGLVLAENEAQEVVGVYLEVEFDPARTSGSLSQPWHGLQDAIDDLFGSNDYVMREIISSNSSKLTLGQSVVHQIGSASVALNMNARERKMANIILLKP